MSLSVLIVAHGFIVNNVSGNLLRTYRHIKMDSVENVFMIAITGLKMIEQYGIVMQTRYWRKWWNGRSFAEKERAITFNEKSSAEKLLAEKLITEPEDEEDYLYNSRLSVIRYDIDVPLS